MSSYYPAKKREAEPPAREIRDEWLKEKIMEVWEGEKGRKVYGARKIWLELNSQGIAVARCTVERLMRELGIGGASPGGRGRRRRCPAIRRTGRLTCWSGASTRRRRTAAGSRTSPMCDTFCGWVYTAFVMDLFARTISAGRSRITCVLILRSMRWRWRYGRGGTSIGGLVHHSDRGVQYTSIRMRSGWRRWRRPVGREQRRFV